MKKVLLLLLLINNALVTNAQKFSIGPTGAFGHSWVDHINKYAYGKYTRKFDPAWNTGLSFVYNLKKHFGLGIDVTYSAEGDKAHAPRFLSGDIGSPANTTIYHINYVRVPVKFVYLFGKRDNIVTPKIYVGPDFGFFSDLQTVVKEDGGDTFKFTQNDQFKNFDFGAMAGGGLNFRLNKKLSISTDLQYSQGLIDIMRDYSAAYHISGFNGNVEVNAALLINL